MTSPVSLWLVGLSGMLINASTVAAPTSTVDSPPLIGRIAPITFSKPGQLAVCPSGDRFAVTDRFANRIFVLDAEGALIWSIGDGAIIRQPQAVMMTDDQTVLFSQWGTRTILRTTQSTSRQIDTVASLDAPGSGAVIKRLYRQNDGSILVLWENPDCLQRWAIDWTTHQEIVAEGSGKGRLDRSVGCALLPGGQIAVAGAGDFPVQIFDQRGKLRGAADWNKPAGKTGWIATAIAVDQRARMWVADPASSRFRVYDQVGNQLFVVAFSVPLLQPTDMVATPGNQLFVLSSTGKLEMYDLTQQ